MWSINVAECGVNGIYELEKIVSTYILICFAMHFKFQQINVKITHYNYILVFMFYGRH